MAEKTSESPFYIGLAPMPRGLAISMMILTAFLFGASAGLAVLLAGAQQDPGTGRWLSDEARTFEGTLRRIPYPMLFYTEDGVEKVATLISTGKLGVEDRVEGLEDQRVRVQGFYIERQGRVSIEFIDGDEAITAFGTSGVTPLLIESLGPRTIRGEIVDSKCFLGVMKPGAGKAHKACATLCLIGGVPPHFVVRHENGFTNALITDPDGNPMPDSLLRYVADPIEASGQLEQAGAILRFRIDPESVRRL